MVVYPHSSGVLKRLPSIQLVVIVARRLLAFEVLDKL
jgi:hypothetical protein